MLNLQNYLKELKELLLEKAYYFGIKKDMCFLIER